MSAVYGNRTCEYILRRWYWFLDRERRWHYSYKCAKGTIKEWNLSGSINKSIDQFVTDAYVIKYPVLYEYQWYFVYHIQYVGLRLYSLQYSEDSTWYNLQSISFSHFLTVKIHYLQENHFQEKLLLLQYYTVAYLRNLMQLVDLQGQLRYMRQFRLNQILLFWSVDIQI